MGTLLEFSGTMPVKRVLDPETFDAVFIGSEDPGTGESWCSDCVISDPIIRGNVPQGATLVECPVGDRAVYKNNPDHPYRTHPEIALTAIPTLIAWGQDGPGARLVEGECHSQEAVVELYASLQ